MSKAYPNKARSSMSSRGHLDRPVAILCSHPWGRDRDVVPGKGDSNETWSFPSVAWTSEDGLIPAPRRLQKCHREHSGSPAETRLGMEWPTTGASSERRSSPVFVHQHGQQVVQ